MNAYRAKAIRPQTIRAFILLLFLLALALGLGATVGLLLGGQQQARAAAHAVQHARRTRQGTRQRIGQADGLVQPRQELVRGGGELAKGATHRNIAAELGVSINTVNAHIQNIFGKLNVTNRIEAVNAVRGVDVK